MDERRLSQVPRKRGNLHWSAGELIASPIPKCSHVAEMVLEYLATFAPRMAQLLRQVCHIHIAWSTWDGTGQSRGYGWFITFRIA